MKKEGTLLWVLVALVASTTFAQPFTVTVRFVPLPNETAEDIPVYIVAANGTIVANGTTDQTGTVTFSLPSGSYLVHIKTNYSVLYPINVLNALTVEISVGMLSKVDVASVPILVDFNASIDNIPVTLRTNATIYRPGDKAIILSFPKEVKRWYIIPYKLYNITYDGEWTNETAVILPQGTYTVVAHYKLAMPVLEPWMLYAIVGAVVVLIFLVFLAGKRGVKQAITDTKRFVQRVGDERRFVKRKV